VLDFDALDEKRLTMNQLVAGQSQEDLARATHELIDGVLASLAGCDDADVQFVPSDPGATDAYASNSADVHLPWTLGHVVVHVTASLEESAALAAEMARGVELHGRSRSEVPWQTVTTLAQCYQRLGESRRMCIASLAMWPDAPHLENRYTPWPAIGEIDARGRFALGLWHAWNHREQIAEIVRQANAERLVTLA
jgi:hypothetical protein